MWTALWMSWLSWVRWPGILMAYYWFTSVAHGAMIGSQIIISINLALMHLAPVFLPWTFSCVHFSVHSMRYVLYLTWTRIDLFGLPAIMEYLLSILHLLAYFNLLCILFLYFPRLTPLPFFRVEFTIITMLLIEGLIDTWSRLWSRSNSHRCLLRCCQLHDLGQNLFLFCSKFVSTIL